MVGIVGMIMKDEQTRHLAVLPACSLVMLTFLSALIHQPVSFQNGMAGDRGLSSPDGAVPLSLAGRYAALVDYSDVLVIRNLNSADSMTITDYFATQRNISWGHVCNVTTSPNEQIDGATFAALANQVKSCINALPPSTAINFLVTTKGVPLGTWRSPWENSSSVDSELALVGGPYEGQIGRYRWIGNPYFDKFVPFTRARWGYYAVTRLTAFTIPEALGLVDKATEAIGHRGQFVFDVDPGKDGGAYQVGNDWMRGAASILAGRSFDVVLDQTYTFLNNYSRVAGYSSWGSNDGAWYTPVNSNSGLEADADTNGVPDGWSYDDPGGTAIISRNSTIVAGGSWSLRIQRPLADGNSTSIGMNVSIAPQRRFFLTGSVNRSSVAGGRGLYLQIKAYDSLDRLLMTQNGSAVAGTANWAGLPQVIYEPVANATKLRVSVIFAEASGSAFVDNVQLIEIRPHNSWVLGSLAETAVSTGGRSFNYGTGYGQSLIADLIRDGVTGVKGYVYEPYLTAIAHSDILFDAYTQGYTLAESYAMASQISLSWMDTIIGDPKLAPYNLSYVQDLAVADRDITFSNPRPQPGDVVDLTANVHNLGHFPAENATVTFYLGDPRLGGTSLGNTTVTVIDGSAAPASIQFDTTGMSGWYDICTFADSPNEFYETNESNNIACNKLGVTTTYSIHLQRGHRLASFPLLPANESVDSVLASLAGCYDYVRWFDSTDLVSPWKSYTPGPAHDSLLLLDNAMGFWINMTSDCDLNLTGVKPVVTAITLHAGWNMVGFPSFRTTYTVADLKAALGLPGARVEVFDAASPPYYLQHAWDSLVMSAGEGYWIFVPSDTTWTVAG